MSIFPKMKTSLRFAMGLRNFLRYKLSLEEAQKVVRQRIEERETNFLRLVERGIFGYSRSPYLPLLKLAGCEMGDIRNMVRNRGLEGTLRGLREAGVYFSFEEYKGREPTVRNGQVISVNYQDFDNPYLQHYYHGETGGTTGVAIKVLVDLDHLALEAPDTMLACDAHGILHVPTAIWLGGLPDPSGPHNILGPAKFGQVPQKWFMATSTQDRSPSLMNRIAMKYIIIMGRFFGTPIPWPELVRWDDAIVISRWVSKTLKAYGSCMITTFVSRALRVCIAAQEEGLDLSGATFMVGGEPATPAKVQGITRTGARCVPLYPFAEHGFAGIGCARPADENDIHLFKDALALIQFPRKVPGSGIEVDAFNFTSLLPTAPKLLLNVESDDYGLIEKRSCGCRLETYGFTEHLRHIRSFRKMTAGGSTLLGSDIEYILEEFLPARFGGSPLDYQLLEEEEEDGFTRLSLLVSPKIQIPSEKKVVEAVFKVLGKWKASQYRQTGTLRIKRMEPILTNRGKLMPIVPLHMTRNPGNITKS
ncbi:hypothetical protein ACFL1Z_08875 [Thermodesulfobacteriota bacterium]